MESFTALNEDTADVVEVDIPQAHLCWFTAKSPQSQVVNEDCCGVFILDGGDVVMAVADGMGGHRGGDKASRTAIESIEEALKKRDSEEAGAIRDGILKGFELAHERIREWGIGAGTTLSVAHISSSTVRFYHVGDSVGLLLGGRGSLKYKTLEHSAAGFGIEAGLIEGDQAHQSEDHHLLLNVVGGENLRIEMSNEFQMSDQDLVLLMSDGFSDNAILDDIGEHIVKGHLKVKLMHLKDTAYQNMAKGEVRPAKPDDLTLIILRRKK